jgi:hypothetical protein
MLNQHNTRTNVLILGLEICPKNKFQFQIKLLNKDKAKLLQK